MSRYSFRCTRSSNCGLVSIFTLFVTCLTALTIRSEGNSPEPLTSSQILGCSGVAKMCASMATYPHEVVRTRLQTQRRLLAAVDTKTQQPGPDVGNAHQARQAESSRRGGAIYTAKRIVLKEGWRGLYKGLSVNLIRTVPNSAVTMLTCVFIYILAVR